ncbi:MAG: hypothetical protein HY706_15255 [Candidatus Hydrogenedentes bacterium]|nr:hypothetical protein [Candidatus Hydrogenedentota bacterium]
MVTFSLSLVVVLAVGAGKAVTAPPPPVHITMVAAVATNESRPERGKVFYGSGCDAIRNAVAELPYNTYRHLVSWFHDLPYNVETPVKVNAQYTAYLTVLSKQADGRFRIKTRIGERVPGGREVNAVVATHVVVPGDQFKFCVKTNAGALIIVFTAREAK